MKRHIHLKEEASKIFSHIVVSCAKEKIIQNMSKFQIGSKSGHRPDEHIFVITSYMALCENEKRSAIFQMMDYAKLFDCESLIDCLGELHKNQIRGKLYRLLYRMNEHNEIQVLTPVGLTGVVDTGEGLGQGGLEPGYASAVSLDNGVQEMFADSDDEVSYADLRLFPLLYMDDLFRMANSVTSAQKGLIKLEQVAEAKLIQYNMTKTCFIVFGNKKEKEKIEEDLDRNPLTLYGENVKRVDSEKYLGWTISGGGLSDCAYKTVFKRRGNIRKAISQIKSVIEDSRCKVLGGIDVALQIWNLSVSPFLYYSSENWIKIEKKTLKILTDLQCEFYRAIFGLPSSSPKPILFFDTKGLLPENMVMKRKLLFYFHLEHLPPSSLAAEILSRQKEYHLNDSLYQECQRFLCLLGLSHPKEYSKQAWKKAVNQVVNEQNRKDLLTLIKDYKKLSHEELKEEDYEVKAYIKELPLQKASPKMRHRSQMLKSVKFNFQSDKEFARVDFGRVVSI